jgi:sugar/nucleoside kinase (ribokinase family)
MTPTALAAQAADALLAANVSRLHALVGFDGFVDAIIDVVATRASMARGDYQRIATIPAFAARCAAAAGKSANAEIVVREERFGGNGPLMAGGLAALSMPTTYVGCVGDPEAPGEVHPLFLELKRRCIEVGGEVLPIGPPSRTECLEFDDGKLMLNNPASLYRATWARIEDLVGTKRLSALLRSMDLVGIVNWTIMPGVPDIWRGVTNALKGCDRPPRVFIDLSDPAKRTDADLAQALALLADMNAVAPVTLGLNLSEAERVECVCGLGVLAHRSGDSPAPGHAVRQAAEAIRERTGLDTIVIHPREGAAAADRSGRSAWVDGPLCARPRLSTGAGDHFNAGFALAQTAGLSIEHALAVGCGVSGAYVRDAVSPSAQRLVDFLRRLPGKDE